MKAQDLVLCTQIKSRVWLREGELRTLHSSRKLSRASFFISDYNHRAIDTLIDSETDQSLRAQAKIKQRAGGRRRTETHRWENKDI